MENILVKLIVIAAIAQLGITLHDFLNCRNRECMGRVEKASRKVLSESRRNKGLFAMRSES